MVYYMQERSDNDIEEPETIAEDDQELHDQNSIYSYSIKVMNPSKMSDFRTADLGRAKAYKSEDSLRKFISNKLPPLPSMDKPDMCNVEVGYVEPGHGMKGRKIWLLADGDLPKMYEKYGRNHSIRLWCYAAVSKKETASAKKVGSKEKESAEQKSEVEETYEQLLKKHKGKYTPEQLRAWSHMIRLKTHDSLDIAPDKPFFRGSKREGSTLSDDPASKRERVSAGVSPGRKVNIRSELINQLDKWHKLLNADVISQQEYDELKLKIMEDIQGL